MDPNACLERIRDLTAVAVSTHDVDDRDALAEAIWDLSDWCMYGAYAPDGWLPVVRAGMDGCDWRSAEPAVSQDDVIYRMFSPWHGSGLRSTRAILAACVSFHGGHGSQAARLIPRLQRRLKAADVPAASSYDALCGEERVTYRAWERYFHNGGYRRRVGA